MEAWSNKIFHRWYIDAHRLNIKEEARSRQGERKGSEWKGYYKSAYWPKVPAFHSHQSSQQATNHSTKVINTKECTGIIRKGLENWGIINDCAKIGKLESINCKILGQRTELKKEDYGVVVKPSKIGKQMVVEIKKDYLLCKRHGE